jgi:hypothetical protein
MPQLDKFIFLNQIVSLTIFFFFIYIYARGTIIPKLSSVLKFRYKKLNKLNKHLGYYNDAILFNHRYIEKKGLKYLFLVLTSFINIMFLYNKNTLDSLINSYNIYQQNILKFRFYSFEKIGLESNRILTILK